MDHWSGHTSHELWALSTPRARLYTPVTYVEVNISRLIFILDFENDFISHNTIHNELIDCLECVSSTISLGGAKNIQINHRHPAIGQTRADLEFFKELHP